MAARRRDDCAGWLWALRTVCGRRISPSHEPRRLPASELMRRCAVTLLAGDASSSSGTCCRCHAESRRVRVRLSHRQHGRCCFQGWKRVRRRSGCVMVRLSPFVWRPPLSTSRASRRPPGDFGGIPSPTAALPATLHAIPWSTCDMAADEYLACTIDNNSQLWPRPPGAPCTRSAGGLTAVPALLSCSVGPRACLGTMPALD